MSWIVPARHHTPFRTALAVMVFGASAALGPSALRGPASPRCRVRGPHDWLASRASPLDSARLIVGADTALLCYSRPSARGRSVYDTLATFGKPWRTGANEPTVLELTGSATVAGVLLPVGRYAILTVPQPMSWLILFHTFTASDSVADDPARVFQTLREVGRGTIPAEAVAPAIETFTIRPVSDGTGHAFLLEWGSFRIRMPVRFGD